MNRRAMLGLHTGAWQLRGLRIRQISPMKRISPTRKYYKTAEPQPDAAEKQLK